MGVLENKNRLFFSNDYLTKFPEIFEDSRNDCFKANIASINELNRGLQRQKITICELKEIAYNFATVTSRQ